MKMIIHDPAEILIFGCGIITLDIRLAAKCVYADERGYTSNREKRLNACIRKCEDARLIAIIAQMRVWI